MENNDKMGFIIIGVLIVAIIGVVIWGIKTTPKSTSTTDTINNQPNVNNSTSDKTQTGNINTQRDETNKPDNTTQEDASEQETENQAESNNQSAESSNEDINFSTTTQKTSETADTKVKIVSIENSADNSEYYEVKTTLEVTNNSETAPRVTARYYSSIGAIRMDFDNVEKDKSGIPYQGSRNINTKGIIRLYHNVSADQTEELYDLGVSKETPFNLSAEKDGNNWIISLKVRYPGETDNQSTDTGSTEFSTASQAMNGAEKSDGAKVLSYSYSTHGNIVKFVLSVQGSSSKPLPRVEANNTPSGNLMMGFPSLVKDVIVDSMTEINLPKGLNVSLEKEGDTSKYIFHTGGEKEYKLYGSTNPNQIIIEIKM